MMMFLWYSMMSKELFDILDIIRMIVAFPSEKPVDPDKVKEDKDKLKSVADESFLIMGKSPDKIDHMKFHWKLFLLFFILVPEVMLVLFTTMVGVKFLAVTGDPGTLIMKAMALKFILMFKKLFYTAFVSQQFDKYMKKAKYQEARQPGKNYWNSWIMTLLKLFISIMFSGSSWSEWNHMLKLRDACRQYFEANPSSCLGNSCGLTF